MRSQADGYADEASDAAKIDCSQPVLVRPEFAPASDVKTILKRYGGLPPSAKQPTFTETDYDKDLTTAMHDLRKAHAAFEALPQKYRDKYKSADELWRRNRNRFEPEQKQTDTEKPLAKDNPTT